MPNEILTVDISSVKDLFGQLDTKIKTRAMKAAMKAGSEIEQAAIQLECPERMDLPSGDALPVGALQSDVIIKTGKDNDGQPYSIVTFGKYTYHVAYWVESGHKILRGKKKNRKETGTEASTTPNDFVSRAFENSEQSAVTAIQETFISQVTTAANKGE